MNLVILTQYYPPEIGAPQARLSQLAKRFIQRGHSVTVLTAMPNYPTGRIFDGYKGVWQFEELEGVTVFRTFIYPTQNTDLFRRLTNYFSFVFSSAILGCFFLKKADFLLVESPPLFLGLSGVWLSLLKRAKLIFNVSDLWPESAVELGVLEKNSLAYRISAKLEKFCYQQAWLVSGQSKGILKNISDRFPDLRVFHLSNGVDTNDFRPDLSNREIKSTLSDKDKTIILYAGLHGLAQGLEQIVETAISLRNSKVQFVLIGDGPEKEKLQNLAEDKKIKNIRFDAPVPHHQIPALLASSDIVLVPLKKYIPGAVPSKLYEAMSSGRPVILIAEGEAADIVKEFECGIVVVPGDIVSLVRAIESLQSNYQLREELGANGRLAVVQHFNRDQIARSFLDHLENSL